MAQVFPLLMVIKWIRPSFKTVTVTVIWGKSILKNNKTAGNNSDSSGQGETKGQIAKG